MSSNPPTAPWLALTLAQYDFWEEFKLHPDRPLSTVAHCTTISGPLNEDAMRIALQQLAQETDVLALRFRDGPDGPRQQIDPARIPTVQFHDLTKEPDPTSAARQMMEADIAVPIDLENDQISALWLLKTDADVWQFYLRGHHIMLDGYGVSLIERRTAALYAQEIGATPELGAFQPFPRYLEEEDTYRAGKHHTRDQEYWAQHLADGPALTILEKDDEDYGCTALSGAPDLPASLPALLRETAARYDMGWPDLLTLLTAAWVTRELKPTQEGLPIWLPYMSRFGSVSAEIPALVVNILPLLVNTEANETLGAFLSRVGKDFRKLRRYGRYRVEQLAADQGLQEGQRFYFSPLINVIPFDSPTFINCTATREVLAAGPGDGFNLTWGGASDAQGLKLWIDADPASKDEFNAASAGLVPFILRACEPGAFDQNLDDLFQTISTAPPKPALKKSTPKRPIAGRLEGA
ncbi:condensation domain-containing protein [Loktanella sp. S4079]|uniref:condensation domain-containing protein n=1 Tax=Loktanella sp. S4079 TaxID=579483 RepID=UPI000696E8CE|nr:condensation domain-containing protein [Loktanella sp. S4079]